MVGRNEHFTLGFFPRILDDQHGGCLVEREPCALAAVRLRPNGDVEMSTRYRADEYADIAKHLKDIEAEKTARINGISLEDAKPVEAPADLDWNGIYGYGGQLNGLQSSKPVVAPTFAAPTNAELFKEFRDFCREGRRLPETELRT
jgi:hypothetical protein